MNLNRLVLTNSTVFKIFFVSVFATALTAKAENNLPTSLSIADKKLELNGKAFRTATLFNVKVYEAGLYLEKKSHNEKEILASRDSKAILLFPLRDISREDTVKAWQYSFEKNCAEDCETLKDEIRKFEEKLVAFKGGDKYRYVFSESGASQFINEKEVFQTTNVSFSKLLLSTWIGRSPPTESLKKQFLGD